MLPSHNSWRTAKVNGAALNLPFFASSIVGPSLPRVCTSLEAEVKNWKARWGTILGEDNERMSKLRGNVVNPDDIGREYGADALRLGL